MYPWWRQKEVQKNLSATLENILAAARAWRRESGRRGEGGEGGEVADYDSGSEGPWYSGTEIGDTRVGE